jgi:hypothetical protein
MSGVNIPITGDASSLVAATNKANAALATIGVAADKASAKITPAMGSMSSGAQKAAAALGPLGGVLSKISPEAGSAASSIAGLASAGQGLAAAGTAAGVSMVAMAAVLGPVAIAVAALAAAYYVLDQNLQAVEEQNRIAAERSDDATKRFKDQKAVIKEIADAYAVAAGNQSAADLKTIALKEKLQAAFAVDLANAQTAVNYAKKQAQNTGAGSDADKARIRAEEGLAAINGRLEMQNALIDQTIRLDEKKASSAKGVNDALKTQGNIEKENAEAHAEYVKMDAERVAKARDHIDNINDQIKATLDLTEAVRRQGMTEWETTAASGAAIDANLRNQIAANTKLGLDTKALEDARVTNHANTAAALTAIDEERHAAEKKALEDAAAIDAEANKVKREAAMDLANFMAEQAVAGLDAMASGFEKTQNNANETANQLTSQLIEGDEHYTKSQKAQLVKRIAEQRAAAKEAFAIAKAARLAEAVITTAMAVMNAYSTGVAIPIAGVVLGPAMAIAAGVTGAIQIATIAAEQPSFHSGKLPDEMNATILKREAVLNTTASAAMGRGQIEAMNNGMTAGRSQGPAPIVIGHRVFEAGLKRSLDSAGVLREALHAGAVYGHRSNRRMSSV